MTIQITIARMPMAAALTWYKNAWLLLKSQPLILLLATSWVLMSIMLATSLPIIGLTLSSLLTPILSFGMANVCSKIRTQETVNPLQVFAGLKSDKRNRLLTLGVFYATIALALLLLTQLIDDGSFMDIGLGLSGSEAINPTSFAQAFIQNPQAFFIEHPIVLAFLFFQIFTIVINALFTYAPLFTGWQNTQAHQAIFLSLYTIGKNIVPAIFTAILLGATSFGLIIALSLIANFIPNALFFGAIMFITLLSLTLFYAVNFTSYHDILTTSFNDSLTTTENIHP